MTDVNNLRDQLATWQQRLLRVYGENHPYTALARVALASGDEGVLQDAIAALSSNASLRKEILGPAQQSLLDKYASREPTPFQQFDGFYLDNEGDDIMQPDDEGHCLFSCRTWELMYGADIRVLVSQDAPREQLPPLIQKLAAWITEEYSKPAIKHRDKDLPL